MAMEFPGNTGITFNCALSARHKQTRNLQKNPFHTKKLFDAIKERSHYGDVKFTVVRSFLKGFPFEELLSWHRTCYQETTHSGMIKRAKEWYERELCGPNEAR